MKTVDQQKWLKAIQESQTGKRAGLSFYHYRMAERVADSLEATLADDKRRGKPARALGYLFQTDIADALEREDTKVRGEIKERHNLTIAGIDWEQVMSILQEHWIHGEALKAFWEGSQHGKR